MSTCVSLPCLCCGKRSKTKPATFHNVSSAVRVLKYTVKVALMHQIRAAAGAVQTMDANTPGAAGVSPLQFDTLLSVSSIAVKGVCRVTQGFILRTAPFRMYRSWYARVHTPVSMYPLYSLSPHASPFSLLWQTLRNITSKEARISCRQHSFSIHRLVWSAGTLVTASSECCC